MTDAELQQLYGRMLARRAGRSPEECVPADALLAIVEGRVREGERLRHLRHVAGCRACQEDLDLLRSVRDAGQELRRPVITRTPLAIAAGIALLIGGATLWTQNFGSEPTREAGADGAVAVVAPIGTVPATGEIALTWHSHPGAQRYEVEVLDSEGAAVFTASTRDTSVQVPASQALASGAEYRWWVRAVLADGSQRRSAAHRFRVHKP